MGPGDGVRKHRKNATELREAGLAAELQEVGRTGSAPHAAELREAGRAAELERWAAPCAPRNVERMSAPQISERLDETEGRNQILARG